MEVKGKIVCKKADNKAFKLGDDWYNCNNPVVPFLEKIGKGEDVTVTYEKKGVSRYVSKIVKGGAVAKVEPTKTESAPAESAPEATESGAKKCPGCGKELKNDKYEYCFTCNKSGKYKKQSSGKSSYDSPEKTAQIQRGNALNAAAAVASSQAFADPTGAKEFTLILAEEFLQWLRAE